MVYNPRPKLPKNFSLQTFTPTPLNMEKYFIPNDPDKNSCLVIVLSKDSSQGILEPLKQWYQTCLARQNNVKPRIREITKLEFSTTSFAETRRVYAFGPDVERLLRFVNSSVQEGLNDDRGIWPSLMQFLKLQIWTEVVDTLGSGSGTKIFLFSGSTLTSLDEFSSYLERRADIDMRLGTPDLQDIWTRLWNHLQGQTPSGDSYTYARRERSKQGDDTPRTVPDDKLQISSRT